MEKKLKDVSDNTLVVKNEKANNFIQGLCDYLAEGYHIPEDLWPRCRVAATFQPNAWAYPGGDVFISAGLLGILPNVDSVMLVLAHELGHVVGRHGSRQVVGRKAMAYSATGFGLASGAALAHFVLTGGAGYLGQVNLLNWLPKMVGSSLAGGFVTQFAGTALFFAPVAALMAHTRTLEWEADNFGQQIAFASGARSEEILKGWREFKFFAYKYFGVEEGMIAKLLADHPGMNERETKLRHDFLNLQARMSELNLKNSISREIVLEYESIHLIFKDAAYGFGQAILDKRVRGEKKHSEISAKTLLSGSGSCLLGMSIFEN